MVQTRLVVPPLPAANETNALLRPFVPRLVIDWLRDEPDVRYRSIDGTAIFADISGFTSLTERLARRGKAGAEEVRQVLNTVFEELFSVVYEYGASLIKWGGDAMLLLFDGEGHTERACRGAWEMQRVMSRIGRVQTSAGLNRLRMSMGIHRGTYEFMLVGTQFRELVITGPAASDVARMEKIADATEIVVSQATADHLANSGTGLATVARDTGFLLAHAPDAATLPVPLTDDHGADLGLAFSAPIREYLVSGVVEVEHRNASVAFIRASGADTLALESGPEALTDAVALFMDACQEAAVEHDVTCFATDVYEDGFKVMLVAGVPRSAGDDEARVLAATRTALDRSHTLPVHAGVNVGRLVSGEFGPSHRRTFSIMGDCVNLAARLMSKAQGSQMVASAAVLARSRFAFEEEPLTPFLVKGKSRPVEASLVGRPIATQSASPRAHLPLIGREAELAQLMAGAEAARAGRGRMIEMVGPAGIGKSRLLQEVVDRADLLVQWTEGDVYSGRTPYVPFHRIFREVIGLPDDASPDALAAGLQAALGERAPAMLEWLPLIGVAAGVEFPPTPTVEAVDPAYRREQLHGAVAAALLALTARPTVFVFNDLDFMDEASHELVRHMGREAPRRPWLVVATGREPSIDAEPERAVERELMVLEPLSPEAASAYLQAASANAPLLPHHRAELLERAGGNPLFLAELITSGASGSAGELPETVEQVVAARIDRLDARQRDLLRTLAVLGMSTDLSMLTAVTDLAATKGQSPMVEWSGLEEFVAIDDHHRVRFLHALIRVAAYEGLSFQRRVTLHGHAASVMLERASDPAEEADLLSLHCFHGERYAEAWTYAQLAGDNARAAFAMAEAAAFYRRALAAADRLPSPDQRDIVAVCESLADTTDLVGEFEDAEVALRRARRAAAGDPLRLAQLDLKTAIVRERTGRPSVAKRWLGKGLKSVGTIDSVESARVKADLMARYARLLSVQGRYREAIPWANRGVAEARRGHHRAAEASCFEYLDWAETALGQGDDDWPAAKALAIYVELNDFLGQAGAHNALGARHFYQGRWVEAIGHYAAAENAYRRSGCVPGAGVPKASRGEILSDQGHLAEAEIVLLEALDILRSHRLDADVGWVKYLLGRVEARRGDSAAAFRQFTESRDILSRVGSAMDVFMVDALRAEAKVLGGDAAGALDDIERSVERMAQVDGGSSVRPLVLRVRGLARHQLGQAQLARFDLLESLAAAEARGAAHERAFTLQALLSSRLERDEPELTYWSSEFVRVGQGLGLVAVPPRP